MDGEQHWFRLAYAASLAGTSQAKLSERALAGEFVFEADKYGAPDWLLASEITAVRSAKKAAKKARPKTPPRPKTTAQQEAEWAKLSARNAKEPRDGPFNAMHLRLTLPNPNRDKPE